MRNKHPESNAGCSDDFSSKSSQEHLSNLLLRVGLYDKEQGRFEAAHRNISKAHQLRTKIFGEEHDETTDCLDGLGSVLDKEGKYREAVAIHKESLVLSQKISDTE